MFKNINKIEIHIVPKIANPIRIQEYGVGIFQAVLTKSSLKKALKKGYITVNDRVATTATFISGGETIRLHIPDKEQPHKKLIFPLNVLYQDDYLAVIHKPAGILVSGNSFKTIANALPQNLAASSLPDAATPQPVHRLDYATTGVLMVGKTSSSIRVLNKMFEEKAVKKTYYAVAIGKMKSQGSINTPIDSKDARTDYCVIESVSSEKYEFLNLLKLDLHTGRRHQIRKHLAGIGNPILGDQKYGLEGLILFGKGMYLHAYSIAFIHPYHNESVFFTDPFPERFQKLFPSLQR